MRCPHTGKSNAYTGKFTRYGKEYKLADKGVIAEAVRLNKRVLEIPLDEMVSPQHLVKSPWRGEKTV